MRKQYELRRNAFLNKSEIRIIHNRSMNSILFAQWLLNEAHVLGIPGRAYGDECDNFIRFSIASSMEDLEVAADRINLLMNKV